MTRTQPCLRKMGVNLGYFIGKEKYNTYYNILVIIFNS